MKKRFSAVALVACLLVAITGTFLVTYSAITLDYKTQINALMLKQSEENPLSKKLSYLDEYIEKSFIKEYDPKLVDEALMDAYFTVLGDRFSFYMTPEELKTYTSDAGGSMVGIGVHASMDPETHGVYITGVMPSSPAEESGMLTGDIIVEVEGVKLTEENYSDTIATIKGNEGTAVKLLVKRGTDYIEFSVVRRQIENQTVIYSKLDGNIANIRVIEFVATTPAQFKAAVEKAQSDGCTSFVFDMRNNPGGNLNAICDILDYLLPEGDLINIVYKDGKTQKYTSKESCVTAPMVVLCNESTASAGELFTAALRDYDYATIIGETTFGKGSMQTTITLPDGSGAHISIAFYNPPCNISYEGIGIEPDIKIVLPEEVKAHFYMMTYDEDIQLQKAVEVLTATNK